MLRLEGATDEMPTKREVMSGNGHGAGGRALGRSEGLCARRGAARRSFRIQSGWEGKIVGERVESRA